MKKSELERQLKKDLEASAPLDFSAVWAKCDEGTEREEVPVKVPVFASADGEGRETRSNKALWLRVCALALAAALVVVFAIVAIFKNLGGDAKDPIPSFSSGSFVIDINPSVKVSYDENGVVTRAKGLNEDGEALLIGVTMVGKDYKNAANELFLRCVQLGYFSAAREDNAALVSATDENGNKDAAMTGALQKTFLEKFNEKNIRGVVITGVVNSALDQAAESYGMDTQKYSLVLSYLSLLDGLTDSERETMIKECAQESVKEIYKKIQEEETALKKAELETLETELSEMESLLFATIAERIEELLKRFSEKIEELYGESANESEEDRREELPNEGKAGWHENNVNQSKEERYEKWIEQLQKYSEQLEDAQKQGEAKRIVEEILATLALMQEEETDILLKAIIAVTQEAISQAYEAFDSIADSIRAKNLTAEEIIEKRLETFGDEEAGEEIDVEEWQKAHAEQFASDWYELKKSWIKERERDLDD
ncbi:MAG: hypothetical protein IJ506_04535 [Clostridia bacterium]|nr:hypothetical protein [Clostridia bacterium]